MVSDLKKCKLIHDCCELAQDCGVWRRLVRASAYEINEHSVKKDVCKQRKEVIVQESQRKFKCREPGCSAIVTRQNH